jgi:hypothetical protein
VNVEQKLIPTLREGVEIIKMIFFKKLKEYLSRKYPDSDQVYIGKLSGAILNDLFGNPNPEEAFASFARTNKDRIETELGNISSEMEEMRIPLTDALRIQFLCDHQEGMDSTGVLTRAREHGVLLIDRDIPMPAKFMDLVRRLGGAFDIIG